MTVLVHTYCNRFLQVDKGMCQSECTRVFLLPPSSPRHPLHVECDISWCDIFLSPLHPVLCLIWPRARSLPPPLRYSSGSTFPLQYPYGIYFNFIFTVKDVERLDRFVEPRFWVLIERKWLLSFQHWY